MVQKKIIGVPLKSPPSSGSSNDSLLRTLAFFNWKRASVMNHDLTGGTIVLFIAHLRRSFTAQGGQGQRSAWLLVFVHRTVTEAA